MNYRGLIVEVIRGVDVPGHPSVPLQRDTPCLWRIVMAVFDLDSDKMQNLIDKEAKGASAPRDAAEGVLFIITSLNTAGIVRVVVFGSDGITEAASAEKMLIDMSSIEPVATREMGTKWVDAPRSGGAPKALIGQLTVIANATTHRPDASIIC